MYTHTYTYFKKFFFIFNHSNFICDTYTKAIYIIYIFLNRTAHVQKVGRDIKFLEKSYRLINIFADYKKYKVILVHFH